VIKKGPRKRRRGAKNGARRGGERAEVKKGPEKTTNWMEGFFPSPVKYLLPEHFD
jgi:hypothetical protein